MKKYELTSETKDYCGTTIYRIKSLKDFGDVKKGDLGGWIEKEDNLSHEGNCWVLDNAVVKGYAVVGGEAWVLDNAEVGGNAIVIGNARVKCNAVIKGNEKVGGGMHLLEGMQLLKVMQRF